MLYVFFCTGQEAPDRKHRFASRCIRLMTMGRWAHVCIGDRHCVLDPSSLGDRYWPMTTFLSYYPSIGCMVQVPTLFDTSLDLYTDNEVRFTFNTFLRWATGFNRRDCMSRVVDVLRECRVPIESTPRRPEWLLDYLHERGCKIFWFDDKERGRSTVE